MTSNEELESMASRWVEAWSKPMYRSPDEAHCAQLIEDLAAPERMPQMIHGSADSLLGETLKIALQGRDMDRVHRYVAVAAQSFPVVDAFLQADRSVLPESKFQARVNLLLLACLGQPALPEPAAVSRAVTDFVDSFPRGKQAKALHPVEIDSLLSAAHLSLIANDIGLLARVLGMVSESRRRQSAGWALYGAIVDATSNPKTPISLVEALRQPDIQARFMARLNIHRRPYPQHGPERESLVMSTPVTANYVFCWAYALLCKPELAQTMDWSRMRELMTC